MGVRIDEARDGGLSVAVEDGLSCGRRFAEAVEEVGLRSREGNRPVLDTERSVPDANDRPLRRPGLRRRPYGCRELREVANRDDQPGSPSRFFGR